MTAQPASPATSIEQQWTPVAADKNEDIIGKLNQLGSGTGVGPNFYPGAADDLKVRFGDHSRGVEYVVLTPQEINDVRAYMDRAGDKPEYKKVRALFSEADTVLARATSYAQEYHANKAKVSLPVAVAAAPVTRSAPHVRAA